MDWERLTSWKTSCRDGSCEVADYTKHDMGREHRGKRVSYPKKDLQLSTAVRWLAVWLSICQVRIFVLALLLFK